MLNIVYTMVLVLAGVGMTQVAHATSESPFEYGYLGGISDGKANARDSGDVCEKYFSTADSNACLNGYNLGFPKGCIGVSSSHDTNAEYMTCFDYFNQTQK
jgi:hypothetical protein